MNHLANFRHAWTPEQAADLQLWLDAADAATITESGGLVSQWDDKSGNARNATQATGAEQPATGTRLQNGLNVIDFTRADDSFDVDLDWTAGSSHTAFVVIDIDNNGTDIYGADNPSAGAASLHVGYRGNGTDYRMNYWSNDWYGTIPGGHTAGHNILAFKWTYNSRKDIYTNGGSGIGNAQAGSPTTPSGGGKISEVVNHGALDAGIAEMVFFNTAVSDDLRNKVEGYLAWKWGLVANLPAAHPYKNHPPYA